MRRFAFKETRGSTKPIRVIPEYACHGPSAVEAHSSVTQCMNVSQASWIRGHVSGAGAISSGMPSDPSKT